MGVVEGVVDVGDEKTEDEEVVKESGVKEMEKEGTTEGVTESEDIDGWRWTTTSETVADKALII